MTERKTLGLSLVGVVLLSAFVAVAPAAGATNLAPGTTGSATQAPIDTGPTTIEDGGNYWVGQTLTSDAFDAGSTVELYHDGAFVTELFVDDGTVTLSTSGRSTGDYSLQSADGTESLSFSLRRQAYSASVAPATVGNAGVDTEASVSIDSNRVGYANVITSPGLNATQIQGLLGGAGTVDDVDSDGRDEFVVAGGSLDTEYTFDFRGIEAGNYTLNLDVLDAEAGDSVTVEVEYVDVPPGIEVDGDGNPSTSVDADPSHEDVDGDGTFGTRDVQVLLNDLTSDRRSVEYPSLFDVDGDGGVDTGDVQALLDELVS